MNEQMNLGRFKIEVLVNMLAMEEKKLSLANKRLDALKWVMLTQGFSEKAISGLIKNQDNTSEAKFSQLASEMAGAIQRLHEEMKLNKEDILCAFANENGKVRASLSRDEFVRYLFAATTRLSKIDVQVPYLHIDWFVLN